MRKRLLLVLLSLLAAFSLPAMAANTVSADAQWRQAKQMVLVIVDDWNTTTGRMQIFKRSFGRWKPVQPAADISIGRSGAAWGRGLHPAQNQGLQKQEGDGRAPAGIFALGDAFGYAGSANTRMPYVALRESQYCMDVNGSPLYNQIVDAREVGSEAVKASTEPMRRDLHLKGDQRYRQGIVIQHNPLNQSGAGSCIFAHLWATPGEATAGCTAMSPETMDKLLAWLQPQKHPVMALLPRAEYERLKHQWNLPEMSL